jgi:GTP-binding protein
MADGKKSKRKTAAEPARPRWASAAIVGRPNVGKSTLFNAFVGRPLAITDAMAGTTRDRLIHSVQWSGRRFDLIDTGGMGIIDVPELAGRIEDQIALAVEEAAVLIFLTDAQDGVTAADEEIAARLHRAGKPVVLAVNKVDARKHEPAAAEFASLGFGGPLAVSAMHRRGLEALRGAILDVLPEAPPPPQGEFAIALVGRRNVGKSTLVNSLAGFERVVADSRPGTTRDSVDVVVEKKGQSYTLVDTAGVRKRRRPENAPEYKSLLRSERALERADAVALMLDAMEGVGALDKRLGMLAAESGKPVVIVVNKWDLTTSEDTTGEYEEYLGEQLPGLSFAPVIFTSALNGRRVWAVLRLLRELWELAGKEIGTAVLNRAIRRILDEQPPPGYHRQVPKIRFAVQKGRRPQRFQVVTVRAKALRGSYRKFFERRLKEELGLEEIPVLVRFKEK